MPQAIDHAIPVPMLMTVELSSSDSFSKVLRWIAHEVDRGHVDDVSVCTIGGEIRVAVVFNTAHISDPPAIERSVSRDN